MNPKQALALAESYTDQKSSGLVYQHPRGYSEMLGDGNTYGQYLIGFYEQMTQYTEFNKVQVPAWITQVGGYMAWKVFLRSDSSAFDPSVVTPDASGTLTTALTNHTNPNSVGGGTQIIPLNTTLACGQNEYIFICLLSQGAPSYSISLTRFTTQAPSAPLRHGFYFSTTQSWSGTMSLAGAPTYGQPAIRLYKDAIAIPDGSIVESKFAPAVEAILHPSLRVNLPSTIYAVVGDTIELFYRGIVTGFDPSRYNINFVASKGNRYKKRWIYTPKAGDSNFTITVTVYDDYNNQLATGSTNVVIVPSKSSPATAKNVLCVGDSLTQGGQWPTELNRRLTGTGGTPAGLGLTNINFIGTQGTAPNLYEGYGGWTWSNYIGNMTTYDVWVTVTSGDKTNAESQESIWQDSNGNQWQLETVDNNSSNKLEFKPYPIGSTWTMPASGTLTFVSGAGDTTNIVYSSVSLASGNPFWNTSTSKLDFKNYCTTHGFSGIDYCFVLLGWNEIGSKTFQSSDHQTTINNAETFINQLHSDYPNCKVVLVGLEVPSQDGLGDNYGSNNDMWNYYWAIQSVFGLNDAYQSIASNATYSPYVYFAHLSSQFDSENNMLTATRAVNLRNPATETYGTNGVHPGQYGYYQVADVAYRVFNNLP